MSSAFPDDDHCCTSMSSAFPDDGVSTEPETEEEELSTDAAAAAAQKDKDDCDARLLHGVAASRGTCAPTYYR